MNIASCLLKSFSKEEWLMAQKMNARLQIFTIILSLSIFLSWGGLGVA